MHVVIVSAKNECKACMKLSEWKECKNANVKMQMWPTCKGWILKASKDELQGNTGA